MDPSSRYDDFQHIDGDEEKHKEEKWKDVFELALYPAFKKRLLPQKTGEDQEKLFVNVANLSELYKVFERC